MKSREHLKHVSKNNLDNYLGPLIILAIKMMKLASNNKKGEYEEKLADCEIP